MQIQATGPTGVNNELSEEDAFPGVRVCMVCVYSTGETGLKKLPLPLVSTAVTPQACDRDYCDEKAMKDPQDPVTPTTTRNAAKQNATYW